MRETARGDLRELDAQPRGIRPRLSRQRGERARERRARELRIMGEQDLAERARVRRERRPLLGHVLEAARPGMMQDHDDVVAERNRKPRGKPRAPREFSAPAQRVCSHLERVEVDVRQAQQRGAQHVAIRAGLFRDEPVLRERSDDAVHGRRRQPERSRELSDTETACSLQLEQHPRGAVDRLDHAHLLRCSGPISAEWMLAP